MLKEENLLIVAVNKAISKFIGSTDVEHINEAFKRIKAVTCNGCDLSELIIDDPEYNLHAMNSKSTPIFDKGIDILLSPIEPSSTNTKKARTVCAHALLMKQVTIGIDICQKGGEGCWRRTTN